MSLSYRSASRTHVGLVRTVNEDSMLARDDAALWIVADGMGGHDNGQWASQTLVAQFAALDLAIDRTARGTAIVRAIEDGNRAINVAALAAGKQMGTTAVVIHCDADDVLLIWVGDSRIYRLRGGQLAQLTRDHTKIGGEAGRVRSNTSAIAAYGSATPFQGVFIDGVFGYGGLNFSTRRLVDNGFAHGERDGSMWFGALSAGIDRDTGALLWSLYGNLQWLDATLGTYAEAGAGRLDLRFDERQISSLSSVLGGRIGVVQSLSFGSVAPQIRGEWQHEFNGSSVQRLDYADIIDPSQYGISTIGWRRDVFTLSLGSRWVLPREWGVDLDLGLRGASGQTSGQLRGQITKRF